ncbi:MAG: hydrogenase nickel incorporation protein HypB [Gammaproteobacteria bacterium]|nr:hydrogenase nickel incorporation protein HypB [Gammaproteobacteria bacterium]
MCNVCGCGDGETRIENPVRPGPAHSHDHPPGHTHSHDHTDSHDHRDPRQSDLHFGAGPARVHVAGFSQTEIVQIERNILSKNDRYAENNRQYLAGRGVLTLNLVSSPGSGKTTLLTTTIRALVDEVAVAVIEGDQETVKDAERIRETGATAIQINTGRGCHLDAHMVGHALEKLALEARSVLFVENVGNLVCPASFDLGEDHKVAILAVTEGEDKPLKYPEMFAVSDLMILNKIDLLPYLEFDVERCIEYARRVNPEIEIIQLSATTGKGIDEWLGWIDRRRKTRVDTGINQRDSISGAPARGQPL